MLRCVRLPRLPSCLLASSWDCNCQYRSPAWLQNLMSNALKFGRTGTAVTVTINCTPIHASAPPKSRSAGRLGGGASRCPLSLPLVRRNPSAVASSTGSSVPPTINVGTAQAGTAASYRTAKVAPGPAGPQPIDAASSVASVSPSASSATAVPPSVAASSHSRSRSTSPASSAPSTSTPGGTSASATTGSGNSLGLRVASRQFSKTPSTEAGGGSSDDEFCAPEVLYSISVCEYSCLPVPVSDNGSSLSWSSSCLLPMLYQS